MKIVNNIFGALVLFAVSCDSNIAMDDNTSTAPQQICVTTNLNMTSRTAVDFATEDSFYLYIDQAGGLYDYFAQMRYEDGAWKSYTANSAEPLEMMLVDSYDEVSFVALYCADKELTFESFMSSVSYDCAGCDMLYAKGGVDGSSISDSAVMSLEFSHILSKLDVSIAVNDPSLGKVVSVSIDGLCDSFDMSANVGANSIVASGDVSQLISVGEAKIHSFIVVPQLADGFVVTVVLESGTYRVRYNREVLFENGEPYSIALEFGKLIPLEITDITAGKWTEGDDYIFEVEQK